MTKSKQFRTPIKSKNRTEYDSKSNILNITNFVAKHEKRNLHSIQIRTKLETLGSVHYTNFLTG